MPTFHASRSNVVPCGVNQHMPQSRTVDCYELQDVWNDGPEQRLVTSVCSCTGGGGGGFAQKDRTCHAHFRAEASAVVRNHYLKQHRSPLQPQLDHRTYDYPASRAGSWVGRVQTRSDVPRGTWKQLASGRPRTGTLEEDFRVPLSVVRSTYCVYNIFFLLACCPVN